MHKSATKHNRIINSKKCVWLRYVNVLKICRAKGSGTGIEYFVLHRVLNAHNNIHHYSSFTAAKVIFFGFSLNAYVCLPAHSHPFSVLFPLARTKYGAHFVLAIVVK